MYKLIKSLGFMAVLLGISLVSCEEDYPKSHIAPYDTELLAIKIVNAGADGKTVVEGTIDEANKTINFPRLDVETNFSALSLRRNFLRARSFKLRSWISQWMRKLPTRL